MRLPVTSRVSNFGAGARSIAAAAPGTASSAASDSAANAAGALIAAP